MPYVTADARQRLAQYETTVLPQTPGEMNYILTRLCDRVLGAHPNYENMNVIVGVLECVKLELARRVLAKYEDSKIIENGDVYQQRPWMEAS